MDTEITSYTPFRARGPKPNLIAEFATDFLCVENPPKQYEGSNYISFFT